MTNVIMIVTFGVMTPFCGYIESKGTSVLVTAGHYLQVGKPNILWQRQTLFRFSIFILHKERKKIPEKMKERKFSGGVRSPSDRFSIIRSELHHTAISDIFSIAIDHVTGQLGLGISVSKIQKVLFPNLRAVNKLSHILYLFVLIYIAESILRGQIQKRNIVIQRCRRGSPIAWAFVTAAIRGIGIKKLIEGGYRFKNSFHTLTIISFQQQNSIQPVGTDPGIPVIGWSATGIGLHPPMWFGEQRLKDPVIGFKIDPLPDLRRDCIQFLP